MEGTAPDKPQYLHNDEASNDIAGHYLDQYVVLQTHAKSQVS
jgi:hypothetical protein